MKRISKVKKTTYWSWEIFVGCMFIGIGIGIIIGETGACTMFGMGIGFILASLIRIERAKVLIKVPRHVGGGAIIGVGIIFIAFGLYLLGLITIELAKLLSGLLIILLGLLVIFIGLKVLKFRVE